MSILLTTAKKTTLFAFVAALLLAIFFVTSRPAEAATVTPTLVQGNESCADLGLGDFELKVEPVADGTFTDGTLEVTIDVRDTASGQVFDWTSNLGVDAVLAKGGPDENLYLYDPPSESKGDTGLHAPINARNGKFSDLSHISFCYDLELQVTKTATTSFTRTHDWTIDKSVTPATWDLFRGDSGTSEYTVAVDKTGFTDSEHAVSGTITVSNPAPFAATVTDVSDVISKTGSSDITASVDCGASFPITMPTKGTLECTYEAALPDGASRTNTATATTNTANLGNGSGQAAVEFGAPTTVVNDSITVDDSFAGAGSPWTFSDDGSQTYSRTFTCDADEGVHENTATIRETGQSDGASVTVNCHALNVSKDAQTSLDRTYTWTIDKSADQSELTLAVGQTFFPVNYSVKVDATSVDSDHAVSGTITVSNPAPISATVNSVSDVISKPDAADIAANVDCGEDSFPRTIAAGGTLQCSYNAALPDDSQRTNTATATLQNNNYDSAGNATAAGTTGFTGNAGVSFANANVNHVDESIEVSDSLQGPLGTVNATVDTLPKEFTYQRAIGPYATTGDRTVDNTASFTTNDTGTTGSDSWSILVHVPANGCTLTIGYWKNHAGLGPQDNVLGQYLPISLGSLSVTSEAQAVQILNFNGDASNGINKLYAQLLAAKLNIANGADGSAVASTISAADSFLATRTPASWSSLTRTQKNQVLSWAQTLDNYNNGIIGPGHCDF